MAVKSAVPESRNGMLPGRGTQGTIRFRGQTPECSGQGFAASSGCHAVLGGRAEAQRQFAVLAVPMGRCVGQWERASPWEENEGARSV